MRALETGAENSFVPRGLHTIPVGIRKVWVESTFNSKSSDRWLGEGLFILFILWVCLRTGTEENILTQEAGNIRSGKTA
jgi:hypothetical protein